MNTAFVFFRRCLAAVALGLAIGAVGVAFHHAIDAATALREQIPALIFLLPLGGALILWLYRLCGMANDRGTNQVLLAVRDHEPIKLRTATLIFLTTVLTHLVGGSSGREGAALQLGGSIASRLSHTLKLPRQDGRVLTMCGMAAAFAALFGTPLTAAVFALEVAHVGVLQTAALAPALLSALTAALLAGWLHIHPTAYAVQALPQLTPLSLVQAALLGVLCALLARLFCGAMHTAHHRYAHAVADPIRRAALGGALVLALTLLVGLVQGDPLGFQTYNGAGGNLITAAVEEGHALTWDFLLKLLFTALTLGCGFRGGEIVPTFACGATFGCVAAPLLGLAPSCGAALGMTALFCGVTNCPIASLLLAYELFGGEGLALFALAIAVTHQLSGGDSLYATQRVDLSKNQLEECEVGGKNG